MQELEQKLQATQARSFELVSGLMAEKEQLVQGKMQVDGIINEICSILSLTNPTIEVLLNTVKGLVPEPKVTPLPKPKPTPRTRKK